MKVYVSTGIDLTDLARAKLALFGRAEASKGRVIRAAVKMAAASSTASDAEVNNEAVKLVGPTARKGVNVIGSKAGQAGEVELPEALRQFMNQTQEEDNETGDSESYRS